jgi:hypothetical protein
MRGVHSKEKGIPRLRLVKADFVPAFNTPLRAGSHAGANLVHCRIIAGLGKVGSETERPTETEPITLSSPNPENLSHRISLLISLPNEYGRSYTGQASDLNHVLKLKVIDLPGETGDVPSSHYAMVCV